MAANFGMEGMSSLPQNQEKISQEREWVKSNYTSPTFRAFYDKYSLYKDFYQENWSQRLKKIKSVFDRNAS
ncbi:MAG: hypothetical protein EOO10_02370 [Chitinophagaceae bacterium]|nr:MAG: hypothetical protein EOO10_02370 [Chitinophagaceae bacterium]